MKTLLTYLLLPIIVILFGYYYTKEKPDVRYTLSERIPIKLTSGTSSESIQQLEIKNVGNSEANQIQVVLKENIISYDLQKYSNADVVRDFISEGLTEIVYPGLPPQGSFKLLITSLGIGKDNIVINHSQGKGTEALSQTTSPWTIIPLALSLIYFAMVAFGLRSSFADSLDSKASYDADAVLKRKRRPVYLGTVRWKAIRKKAIENKISRDRAWSLKDVLDSQSYVLLNMDRPDYLDEDEWASLITKASELISNLMSKLTVESYSATEVLNLLKIEKPRHFRKDNWDSLMAKAGNILVLMKKTEYALRSEEELLKAMMEKRPERVPENKWSDYMSFLEREYFRVISEALEMKGIFKEELAPLDYLSEQKLKPLDQKRTEALRKRAYDLQLRQLPSVLRLKNAEEFVKSKRPAWMKEGDYQLLLEIAEETVALDRNTQKYDSLMRLLWSIVSGHTLMSNKPELISEEEWQKITSIDYEIRACKLERERLADDRTIVTSLKSKIERQLDIIHNLLRDPSSIERIEDYSNVFSPGNFANLKALSSQLREKGT